MEPNIDRDPPQIPEPIGCFRGEVVREADGNALVIERHRSMASRFFASVILTEQLTERGDLHWPEHAGRVGHLDQLVGVFRLGWTDHRAFAS